MLGISSRDAIRVVRDIMAGLTIVFIAPFPVGEAHPRATVDEGLIVAQCGPDDNWDPTSPS